MLLELAVRYTATDNSHVPRYSDCLKSKLEQLRRCRTEFADSNVKVRYRKYAKMRRTRNDGSEYFEVAEVDSDLPWVETPGRGLRMGPLPGSCGYG